MKVVNSSQPFSVGDTLVVEPDGARPGNGKKSYVTLTVASWRPGIDVHALDSRRRSTTVVWDKATAGRQPHP